MVLVRFRAVAFQMAIGNANSHVASKAKCLSLHHPNLNGLEWFSGVSQFAIKMVAIGWVMTLEDEGLRYVDSPDFMKMDVQSQKGKFLV